MIARVKHLKFEHRLPLMCQAKFVVETELIMAELFARWFVDYGWSGVERHIIAHADYPT
jgi:hypothetical protein